MSRLYPLSGEINKPIFVYADGELIDERKVKVLNIEEDIQGKDLLTFKYKKKKYKSYRVSK